MSQVNLFKKTAGFPFLDDTFDPSFLLSLLAKKRMQLDIRAGNTALVFSAYLQPAEGWRVFRENCVSQVDPLPHEDIDVQVLAAINQLRGSICEELPHWRPELSLPVHILQLKGNTLSSSATSIPQHIFISNQLLADENLLIECYIHELSHLWLTCYAEIFDLQVVSRRNHKLPSGTPGKDARGVIYAAFFAASVLYYLNATDRWPQRVVELANYLAGCLSTLSDHLDELSPSGRQLHQRMIEFQQHECTKGSQ